MGGANELITDAALSGYDLLPSKIQFWKQVK